MDYAFSKNSVEITMFIDDVEISSTDDFCCIRIAQGVTLFFRTESALMLFKQKVTSLEWMKSNEEKQVIC